MTDNLKFKKESFNKETKDIIKKGFKEYATEKLGDKIVKNSDYMQISYSDQEKIIATLVYRNYWGSLEIKYLFVEKEHRNKNLATDLMNRVCDIAKKDFNPSIAYLSTLSFQALNFYLKLGFEVEFVRDNFKNDIKEYYLKKKLN